MSSDNFHFDITGAPLDKALDIAFVHNRKTVGWAQMPAEPHTSLPSDPQAAQRKRLVLFWTAPSRTSVANFQAFPAPMDAAQVEPIVRAWLDSADYGHEPDHDGSNSKGWRVYNEAWGHVAGQHTAFVAIEPCWNWHGK